MSHFQIGIHKCGTSGFLSSLSLQELFSLMSKESKMVQPSHPLPPCLPLSILPSKFFQFCWPFTSGTLFGVSNPLLFLRRSTFWQFVCLAASSHSSYELDKIAEKQNQGYRQYLFFYFSNLHAQFWTRSSWIHDQSKINISFLFYFLIILVSLVFR